MAKRENTDRVPGIDDSGFFVLRTPMLPMEEFSGWSDSLSVRSTLASGGGEDAARIAWSDDIRLLRARLRSLIQRPEIVQALFVASPALEASLKYWVREPDSKKGLQAERSLVRYFVRMCGRSTPFGLFSGCSVGRIAAPEESRPLALSLEERGRYRTHCRLDFDYLFALTAALRNDPAIAGQLRYWPNSSLRRIGDVWHYIESRVVGTARSHHLVKLYNDDILASILTRARSGVTLAELNAEIRRQPFAGMEIAEEEADLYLRELIRSEVLVSSLIPAVTGQPALDDILQQIAALPAGARPASALREAKDSMAELDRKGIGTAPAEYRAVAEKLKALPAEVDIAKLFQVDMTKPLRDAWLPAPVVDEMVSAINVMCRVGSVGEMDHLRTFRDAFVARYDRAWVPLLQALDEESGLGFGGSGGADASPLLRGIEIPGRPDPGGPAPVDLQALLRSKVLASAANGVNEIVLEASDLPVGDAVAQNLPDSFDFNLTLVAPSMEAVGQGDYRICAHGFSGPSGARMLGRFCHLDSELESHVRRHLREEEAHDPDAVYAEIVYLPEGRVGNVLCRPVLRDYEIAYLGRSGADPGRQLPVSDLLVSVSQSQEIVLFSRSLGKRVIPRLTNAHGYMSPKLASVYRFLCYLQHQNAKGAPMFNWGHLDSQKTLPRVRVGKVVLACARWKLDPEEIKALDGADRYLSFLAVQKLRRERGLPRWVLLVESDNTLPADLDNPLSVDALVHVLKRSQWATLQEMYPDPDGLCVSGPEGHFHHEMLVPFVRRLKTAGAEPRAIERQRRFLAVAKHPVDPAVRTLPPGTDWVYVKLYGGQATLDDLLTSALPPLLAGAAEAGVSSRWFFLRYADPHQHLRLRFRMSSPEAGPKLMTLVSGTCNPLLAAGRIWKIQFDTYEREIERYGGPAATLAAEEIFCADSAAALDVLQSLDGDAGLDLRWRLALLGADRLLADFGLDLAGRREAAERMRDGYMAEFHAGAAAKKQLGDRFRAERRKLEGLFADPAELAGAAAVANRAFAERSRVVREAAQKLRALDDAGALLTPIDDLIGSFLHMHVNRSILSSQRTHELVLYDFLYRLYDGKLARSGKPVAAGRPERESTELAEIGAL